MKLTELQQRRDQLQRTTETDQSPLLRRDGGHQIESYYVITATKLGESRVPTRQSSRATSNREVIRGLCSDELNRRQERRTFYCVESTSSGDLSEPPDANKLIGVISGGGGGNSTEEDTISERLGAETVPEVDDRLLLTGGGNHQRRYLQKRKQKQLPSGPSEERLLSGQISIIESLKPSEEEKDNWEYAIQTALIDGSICRNMMAFVVVNGTCKPYDALQRTNSAQPLPLYENVKNRDHTPAVITPDQLFAELMGHDSVYRTCIRLCQFLEQRPYGPLHYVIYRRPIEIINNDSVVDDHTWLPALRGCRRGHYYAIIVNFAWSKGRLHLRHHTGTYSVSL